MVLLLMILACGARDETSEEVFQRDGLGGVVTIDFVVDALDELCGDLLTDLQTHDIGGALLVVAGVGTFVDTFHKLIHVGCVDNLTLLDGLTHVLRLCETDGVAQRVDVGLEVGFGSGIAASGECGSGDG